MKLQDAYAAEQTALGTWAVIGYKAPGGSNFEYAEDTGTLKVTCASGVDKTDAKGVVVGCDDKPESTAGAGDGEKGVVATSTATSAWTAKNVANLNDCVAGVNWNIAATINKSSAQSGMVSYEATIPGGTGCEALTPNFTKIGM